MKNVKNKISLVSLIALIVLISSCFVVYAVNYCPHTTTSTVIEREADCVNQGQKNVVCSDCSSVVGVETIDALGHGFAEPQIVEKPTADKDGIHSYTCKRCGFEKIEAYACEHKNATAIITKFPGCAEEGAEYVTCVDCEKTLSSYSIVPAGHSVEKWEITTKPTANADGIQSGVCKTCGDTVENAYICPHDEKIDVVVKEPTCQEKGLNNAICGLCERVINEYETDVVSCSYGSWNITQYAVPGQDGVRNSSCVMCGDTKTENYSFSMPSNNSIYIPGTGICHRFAITEFSQAAVDGNDITYSYASNFGMGSNDPFVLGHNYGTMQHLSKTKVGQYIYLNKNGVLEIYEVVISEFGMQNSSWTDIIGQTSGYSIFDNLGAKTLHMYTCYGGTNGRWMVLAKLVG